MTSSTKTIIILASVLTTACCGDWQSLENLDTTVWADDGSEIGYSTYSIELKEGGGTGFGDVCESRNEKVSIYTDSIEQDNPKLVKTIPNTNLTSLFYMKSSGYLLLSHHSDSFKTTEIVDLDGNTLFEKKVEIEYCRVDGKLYNQHFVIPSPNGERIAEISTDPACNGNDVVRIIDRDGFSESANYSIPSVPGQRMRWRPDNSLIVEEHRGHTDSPESPYIEFDDEAIYKEGSVVDCQGVTSSGSVSSTGLNLQVGSESKIEAVEYEHTGLCEWEL